MTAIFCLNPLCLLAIDIFFPSSLKIGFDILLLWLFSFLDLISSSDQQTSASLNLVEADDSLITLRQDLHIYQ